MAREWGFTTTAIHGGKFKDTHKSVAVPIYQTATYYFDTAEEGARLGQEIPPGFVYTRWANPTTRALEERVALLEGAEDALATASGMGAVSCAVLAAVKPGDHAVAPSAIYQATYQLFAEVLPSYGIETTLLPDTDAQSYERALRPNTRLLFIETPNNPVLGVTDIEKVTALARSHDALTIADNTWATPYNQRPIEKGVDVVVHSATKYLGGHHDVTAGVIAGSASFIKQAKRQVRILGTTPDPFGSWLVIRGLATLALRVGRQNASAQRWLSFSPGILASSASTTRDCRPIRDIESHPDRCAGLVGCSVSRSAAATDRASVCSRRSRSPSGRRAWAASQRWSRIRPASAASTCRKEFVRLPASARG